MSDSYENNFWGKVDLYRGYIGYGILVFTVLGITVSILGIFTEMKQFQKRKIKIKIKNKK